MDGVFRGQWSSESLYVQNYIYEKKQDSQHYFIDILPTNITVLILKYDIMLVKLK